MNNYKEKCFLSFLGDDRCFEHFHILLSEKYGVNFFLVATKLKQHPSQCTIIDYIKLSTNTGNALKYFCSLQSCDVNHQIIALLLNEKAYILHKVAERSEIFPHSFASREAKLAALCGYVYNFLASRSFDCILYPSTPHFLVDLLFCYMAEYMNIPIYILDMTLIGSTVLVRKSAHGNEYLKVRNQDSDESECVSDTHSSPREEYSKHYVRRSLKKKQLIRIVLHTVMVWHSFLKKNDGGSLYDQQIYKFPLILLKQLLSLYRIFVIRKIYAKVCQQSFFDSNFKYLYLALPYQPERTSLPEASHYTSIPLLIETCLSFLPSGWKLLIKEHPRQLEISGDIRKFFSRSSSSYPDTYLSLIQWLPASFSDPISISHATACLTGSSGWESILQGKPVLIFGTAWYQLCNAAYRIADNFETDVLSVHNHLFKPKDVIESEKNKFLKRITPYLLKGANRNLFSYYLSEKDLHNFSIDLYSAIFAAIEY